MWRMEGFFNFQLFLPPHSRKHMLPLLVHLCFNLGVTEPLLFQ